MSRPPKSPSAGDSAPASAADTPATDAAAPVPAAVLLRPWEGIGRGVVVQGARAAALIDGVQARAATPADIAIAGVHVRPID